MAQIAKAGTPSLATENPPNNTQHKAIAAVALTAGDMVYITAAGKFDLTDGTADDIKARWYGMVKADCPAGESATAFRGLVFRYGSGLTPATRLYVSAATPGGLADAATTGGDVPCADVLGPTLVYIRICPK